METLRFVETTHDGKLVLELPEEFRDQQLEVTVKPLHEVMPKKKSHEEFKEMVRQFIGSAPYPEAKTDKYDVYDQ